MGEIFGKIGTVIIIVSTVALIVGIAIGYKNRWK